MNNRSNNPRHKNNHEIQKKVIRCDKLHRPMYEHEVCPQYSIKSSSESQKNCKSCVHSS